MNKHFDTQNLLVEIGTEELPSDAQEKVASLFATNMRRTLKKAQLDFGNVIYHVGPRRFAVIINELVIKQPDYKIEKKGPSVANAYDSKGEPTQACLGFAHACQITPDALEVRKTEQGEWLYFTSREKGKPTVNLLPYIVETAVSELTFKRAMRWKDNHFDFIRPVHWLLVLYGDEPIPITLFGHRSEPRSFGHRFHHPKPVTITKPNNYLSQLEHCYVIADHRYRRQLIRKQAIMLTEKVGEPKIDNDLLNEVTGLVEWPVVLIGQFQEDLLKIPPEVLITSMQQHQKSFPVFDKKGKLLPKFIIISNIQSQEPNQVILGNERVMHARLNDAKFFYETDCQKTLESRLEALKTVIFQHDLGSLYSKSERLSALTALLAETWNQETALASRAGLLSKTDLTTEMVKEFPSLQGIMGYYYALNDDETSALAEAIRDHYLPTHAGDPLPKKILSCALAISDKIDTIVGIFGINQAPTGDKDPFALRRAALGVVRILIEKQLSLDLRDFVSQTISLYKEKLKNREIINSVLIFILERLRAWYQEQGVDTNIINSILAVHPSNPLDIHYRLKAVKSFLNLPASTNLIANNKRVNNILRKAKLEDVSLSFDDSKLKEPAEIALANQSKTLKAEFDTLFENYDYTQALSLLASLQQPLEDFFNHVMVMTDDIILKENRLALLQTIQRYFMRIADISLL